MVVWVMSIGLAAVVYMFLVSVTVPFSRRKRLGVPSRLCWCLLRLTITSFMVMTLVAVHVVSHPVTIEVGSGITRAVQQELPWISNMLIALPVSLALTLLVALPAAWLYVSAALFPYIGTVVILLCTGFFVATIDYLDRWWILVTFVVVGLTAFGTEIVFATKHPRIKSRHSVVQES